MKDALRLAHSFLLLTCFLFHNALFAQPGDLLFTARLTGDQVVPSINTPAEGLVTLLFSPDRAKIQVNGLFSKMSGKPTAVHLHFGAYGENGDVEINLGPVLKANRLAGDVLATPSILKKLFSGNIYVNVHTAANPDGEIRGQLNPECDWNFVVIGSGFGEVPPVLTTGALLGGVHYSLSASKLQYQIQASGLTGPITAAHIHEAPEGQAGPVVTPLGINGNQLIGELDLTTLPTDFLLKCLLGNYYVNVHTAANPAGELRGQLFFGGYINAVFPLSGSQETPPNSSAANGMGIAEFNATFDSLTVVVVFDGLTPTAAHIHRGPAGSSGGVVVPFETTFLPGLLQAKLALDSALLGAFYRNGLYANLHTTAHPGGEIRGQVTTSLRRGYAFDLCGDQQVPSTPSGGYGVASVSIDQANTVLRYQIQADGLNGNGTTAHIHSGTSGVSGPVLFPLIAPAPFSSGSVALTTLDANAIENGATYVNLHSTAFPNGEIRGQVRRGLECLAPSAANELVLNELAIFPNPFSDNLTVKLDCPTGFDGQFWLTDVSGKMLWQRAARLENGPQELMLDLPMLPPGSYFLTLRRVDSTGLVFAKTLVKI